MSGAEISAFSCVLLIRVVGRLSSFHPKIELLVNPVPLSVSQNRNTLSQCIKGPFVLIKRDAARRQRPDCAKHPVGLITESSNGSVVRATNAIERETLRGALILCGGIDTRRVRDPHSNQGVDI